MLQDQLKEKIKRSPEDFVVKEVLDLELNEEGPFSYYILEKRNRNTLDVLEEISKKLEVPLFKFGFSGLKDKLAVTTQYISIHEGPERSTSGKGWKLKFIGKGPKGIGIGDAKGNIFTIRVFDVDKRRFQKALELVEKHGFANYFGEQRFSCDLYSKKPIGRLLLEGRIEEALKEYFTQGPNRHASRRLEKLWGKWDLFLLEAKHLSVREKAAIKELKKNKSFERAFRVLPKNLKLMFFFSYQSMLWNRLLKRLIKKHMHYFKAPFVVEKNLFFYNKVHPFLNTLKQLEIPYLSKEALERTEDSLIKTEMEKILREERLSPEMLEREVEGLKVFSKGARKAVVVPEQLKILEKGRKWVRIQFFLPSGSYATVLLRKLIFFTP